MFTTRSPSHQAAFEFAPQRATVRIAAFTLIALVLSMSAQGVSAGSYILLPNADGTTMPVLNPITGLDAGISGVDLYGGDSYSVPMQDVENCALLCAQQGAQCGAYVFRSGDSTCFLKAQVEPAVLTSGAVITVAGLRPQFTPFNYDIPHMKALCEVTAGCVAFSSADGFLRSFSTNNTVNTYVSNSTCGNKQVPVVEAGSPFDPSGVYSVCQSSPGTFPYVVIASFTLPPFLLEEACDKNPLCAGFMTTADGSSGWLLGWTPAPSPSTTTTVLFSSALLEPAL